MMSIWTRDLSIGNRILDSEHKKLYGLVSKIARSIAARDVAALSEAFDLLENCLCAYFAVEESIAQAINFDFTKHEFAHQCLLNEFQCMKAELAAKSGMWSDEEGDNYARSLMGCLIRHVEKDGRPLKIVLDTHLYDFCP